MSKLYLYSYNKGSEGGKSLAKTLGINRIKHSGSKFKGNLSKTVINWGSSSVPDEVSRCNILNTPDKIAIASNKLSFFSKISNLVSHPDWTDSKSQALMWLEDGFEVCARTVLNGHSANGLILVKPGDELPHASLYTRYVQKKDEYRVHILDNEIIDVQRKARKLDVPGDKVNWKVRNLANGFIYAREGFVVPEPVKTLSIDTVALLGLNFGAVDVIWNDKQKKPYVLEVNTAPGLVGTTLELYAEAFRAYL